VVGNKIAVKKYVVRFSAEERAQLDELIRKSKRPAQLLRKAASCCRRAYRSLAKAGATAGLATCLSSENMAIYLTPPPPTYSVRA